MTKSVLRVRPDFFTAVSKPARISQNIVLVPYRLSVAHDDELKEVAFIMGKSENQAAKKIFIRFFINYLIANISLYVLSWPKLNFGCYLTF